MGKLYLHIGTHKTATSAIQQYVYNHAKELQDKKLNVLKHSDLPFRKEFRQSEEASSGLINVYKNHFKNFIKDKNQHYLLCWEGFSGNPDFFYQNNTVTLKMLFEALPKDINVEIIVVFRRQDEFVQSIFTQLKHQGEKIELKDLFKIQYYEGLDWLKFTNTIQHIFGENIKVHVLPYEPSLLNQKNMLQLLGERLNLSPLKNISILPQRNVGFSENAARIYDQISKSLESEHQSKTLRRSLQKVDNKGIGNEYHYLSYNEKVVFLKHYEESNIKLAQEYWQKEFNLTNFSSPQQQQPINQKKTTEALVIIDLLKQLEENKTRLNSNIFFRIVNKLLR